MGDAVLVLGNDLKIAGLSQGTFGIATSISFVNKTFLAKVMGVSPKAASYVLIHTETGRNLDALTDRLRQAVPDSNLMTQEAFIASDQKMIRQMGADVIRAMSLVFE